MSDRINNVCYVWVSDKGVQLIICLEDKGFEGYAFNMCLL